MPPSPQNYGGSGLPPSPMNNNSGLPPSSQTGGTKLPPSPMGGIKQPPTVGGQVYFFHFLMLLFNLNLLYFSLLYFFHFFMLLFDFYLLYFFHFFMLLFNFYLLSSFFFSFSFPIRISILVSLPYVVI
jgi:hypothetical protein